MEKIFMLILLCSAVAFGQKEEKDNVLKPFHPEHFKEFPHVRDISISNSKKEMYFTVLGYKKEFSFIAHSLFKNGKWSKPEVVSFSGQYKDLEPFLSPNNLQLFFASNRPLNGEKKKDFDLWVVERGSLSEAWGTPRNLGVPINTLKDEFYPAVSKSGNLYYTATIETDTKGKEDIYFSEFKNGVYSEPTSLSAAINSETYEFNAFISPNEDVLLFSSYNRPDGQGGGDLYISKKDGNGNWTEATNLGPQINTDKIEYCPFLDIKTNILYFTSERSLQRSAFANPKSIDDLLDHFRTVPNGLSRIYSIKLQ